MQELSILLLYQTIEYLNHRLTLLNQQKSDLTVRSETDGIFFSLNLEEYKNMWISRGTPLGQLISDEQFIFIAVVSEQNVSQLFNDKITSATIKITSQPKTIFNVSSFKSIPMERTDLPSPSLGWSAGGDIAIDINDKDGLKAAEPFYEVRANINNEEAMLYHGVSGKIRFNLPAESLVQQGWRLLRQMIQKRYQV